MDIRKALLFSVILFTILTTVFHAKTVEKNPKEDKKSKKDAFEEFRKRRMEERGPGSKRFEEAKKRVTPDFTSPRVQRIWEEAKRQYSGEDQKETLNNIKKELIEFNDLETNLVSSKKPEENKDKIRGLQDKIQRFFKKYEPLQPRSMKLTPENDSLLQDEELKRLWSRVKTLDFLEDKDISELQGEFIYCQHLVIEFSQFIESDIIAGQLNDIGRERILKALSEGQTSEEELFKDLFLEHGIDNVRRVASFYVGMAREVGSCYNRLDHYTNDTIRKEGFKEPLVNTLWMDAQKTNMTQLELTNFRSELENFQHRIRKQTNVERNAKAMERKYSDKIMKDPNVPHTVKMDMSKKLEKVRNDNKGRIHEINKILRNLTDKIKSSFNHEEL